MAEDHRRRAWCGMTITVNSFYPCACGYEWLAGSYCKQCARVIGPTTGAANHFDAGKVPLDLVPTAAVELVAKVFGYGATKYGDYNWQRGMPWRKLLGSTLRHLFAWARGIDTDPESGLSHLAHAACNILMLVTYQTNNLGEDNRARNA